jgi:dihydroorotase
VIATDHAPHTIEEKEKNYTAAPAGGPLVQHSLPALIEFFHQGKITLEKIAEKAAHNVAECFQIQKRGFIREGYFADLVLIDPSKTTSVTPDNIAYKCGWSPLDGSTFNNAIDKVWVNGTLSLDNGNIQELNPMRLKFKAL